MKHYGDVSKINGVEVEPVDIITFGSPCQDLSVAGKRAGIQDGERSNLFFEAVRIIKEMRRKTNGEYPKYAVWENVPGAFSSNKGHDFHAVLEALCSVCDGAVSIPKPYDAKQTDKLVWNKAGEIVGDNYSIAWRTLDAQYWGVPQRRKRIYLVADFTGRCAGEILFKPESLRGDMPQGDETWQGTTSDAVGSVDGGVGAAGVVSKGNGDCFIMPERHMSLSVGGGQAGQGYPCVLHRSVGVECLNPWDCQSKRIYSPNGIYCTLPAMDCGGANNQAVIYSFDSLSSNSMKSSNPTSGCRAVEIAKCIDTTYPDPSKNQGGVAVVECIGFDMYNQSSTGDKTRTLKTPAGGDDLPVIVLNDQGGSSMKVESEEISPTLRASSHQHEPVIALQANQQSLVTTEECSNTLGANDWKEPQVIALQGNGIDRADTAGCNGCGWRENENYTLNTVDRHAVCFEPGAMVRDMGNRVWEEQSPTLRANMGDNQPAVCYDARGNGDGETVPTMTGDHNGRISDYTAVAVQETLCFNEGQITSPTNGNNPQWNEPCHTLSATDNRAPTVILKKPPRKYIIRRLTPTECARLQGFPDWWSELAPYNPDDAEFWEEVRKTHAEINGKKYKPVKNLKKWYDKLHTDSSEYKLWGNGIALPNAEYVLRGIAEHGAKTLGSLFDGSGGFPLAGVLNGIKPIWASEVEPYPIAVTTSRFKEVTQK